jgi:hypothetical protein
MGKKVTQGFGSGGTGHGPRGPQPAGEAAHCGLAGGAIDHGDCTEWFRDWAASLTKEAKGLAEEQAERDRETEEECES